MAFTFRAATTALATNATSVVINTPAGVVDGDLLVLSVGQSAIGRTVTATGWTLIRSTQVGFTNIFNTYYLVAASEPASYTIGFNASTTVAMAIVAYSGGGNNPSLDADSGQANGTASLTVTTPGVTPAHANVLLVWGGLGGHSTGTSTFTPPTGMTERADITTIAGSQNPDISVADAVYNNAGVATGNRNGTLSASQVNIGHLAAFYVNNGYTLVATPVVASIKDTDVKRTATPIKAALKAIDATRTATPVKATLNVPIGTFTDTSTPVTASLQAVDSTLVSSPIVATVLAQGMRTATPITATLRLDGARVTPDTAALRATGGRTANAIATLQAAGTTRTAATAAAIQSAAATRQATPITAALQAVGASRQATPVTAAFTALGAVRQASPTSATLWATATRTAPDTAALKANGTARIATPVTATLAAEIDPGPWATIRTFLAGDLIREATPVTASLQAVGTTRTATPVTASLTSTATRTAPATASLWATASRTAPTVAALQASAVRVAAPVTACLQSTVVRVAPSSASLTIAEATLTAPNTAALTAVGSQTADPVTAALQSTEERTAPATATLSLFGLQTASPVVAALKGATTLTAPNVATLRALGLKRTATPVTAAIRRAIPTTTGILRGKLWIDAALTGAEGFAPGTTGDLIVSAWFGGTVASIPAITTTIEVIPALLGTMGVGTMVTLGVVGNTIQLELGNLVVHTSTADTPITALGPNDSILYAVKDRDGAVVQSGAITESGGALFNDWFVALDQPTEAGAYRVVIDAFIAGKNWTWVKDLEVEPRP